MSRDRDCRPNVETTNSYLAHVPTTAVIEDLLASGLSIVDLRREYNQLRDRYDAGRRTPRNVSKAAVAAYAVGRLPATMAVNGEALRQLASAIGGWEPRSLLDLGSGLGSSTWAAVSRFPTLEHLSLVEEAPAMVAAGQAIAEKSNHSAVRDAQWVIGDSTRHLDRADLVVASYVLGELDQPENAVGEWWRDTMGALVIIEPGTPAGFERILLARAQLVAAGATVAAPCPHNAACPLTDPGWCHFAARVTRSRLHREIKGGTLSTEDEKFSYVAATRFAMGARPPRIVREPARHGGHVRLELCADTGLYGETVSKRVPDYPRIRKLRWGDVLAPSASPIASFVSPHLTAPEFRRLTLSGGRTTESSFLRKAVVRPVEIQGQRQLQVVTYDERRATTVNVPGPTSAAIVDLLRRPFRHVVVALADEVLEGRVTKRGQLVTSRAAVSEIPLDLRHDRQKRQPIPPDAPFLDAIGISVGGRVKPTRRAKYRQINDFIRQLDQSPTLDMPRPVRIVDVGCGNAYLTFATVHHLVHNRGIECSVVGVDRNSELIQRNIRRADALGWSQLQFQVGDIATYEPDTPPDVVMVLHACDTAADYALAAMVRWGSHAGFVAPCCHHHVQSQLRRTDADAGDHLLLRDGILRERLGDVLTDATRSAILRLVGYDVDVVQFVDPEHTPRNTLIRASKGSLSTTPGLRAAYEALTRRWSIQPLLADLLARELNSARAAKEVE